MIQDIVPVPKSVEGLPDFKRGATANAKRTNRQNKKASVKIDIHTRPKR
jgi:hypothetical protein